MKHSKYRIPLLFAGVLTLFVIGIGVIDQLTTPTDEVGTDTQVIQTGAPISTGQADLTEEAFLCPVQDGIDIVRYYYEIDGQHNDQALDVFEGVYRQSQGIDYGAEETFEVIASLSGTVSEINKDALLGLCVTIDCENGVKLIYQSLSDVGLEEGQSIAQGSLIGNSGHNIYEADLGNHVHFTVEKDGETLNPLNVYSQKVGQLE